MIERSVGEDYDVIFGRAVIDGAECIEFYVVVEGVVYAFISERKAVVVASG